ncbi:MAG TPA: hypothetical protein VGJ85_06400 [Candidatus Nanopelagicaceae bacterium]
MSTNSGPFVLAVVTQEETRMWFEGLDHGAEHKTVKERNPFDRHNHIRMAQHNRGHDIDEYMPDYLEEISKALEPAREVLLIVHGKGKGSAVPLLTDYFEKKHPQVAKKVADVLDVDITRMTEPQLLAVAREWWEKKYGVHEISS